MPAWHGTVDDLTYWASLHAKLNPVEYDFRSYVSPKTLGSGWSYTLSEGHNNLPLWKRWWNRFPSPSAPFTAALLWLPQKRCRSLLATSQHASEGSGFQITVSDASVLFSGAKLPSVVHSLLTYVFHGITIRLYVVGKALKKRKQQLLYTCCCSWN